MPQGTARKKLVSFFLVVGILLLQAGTACSAASSGIDDFSSDGCSLFPDGTPKDRSKWCDCCFAHDIAYWRGGTEKERKAADLALRDCVLDRTGNEALAEAMYLGVRAGGHPIFPTWYRWAYGWSYGRGYVPLTEDERTQAGKKLQEYFRKHPEGYCNRN